MQRGYADSGLEEYEKDGQKRTSLGVVAENRKPDAVAQGLACDKQRASSAAAIPEFDDEFFR
jgi:hypothetical protein